MKAGIMQPYFFPYIGYWQLINAVDKFIIYDNIQFTKQSWIRRNRILMNGQDKMITIPITKDSDYLNVNERYISESFDKEAAKLLNQVRSAYKKAPQYEKVFPILQGCISYDNKNLFDFLLHSISVVLEYLEIKTETRKSSSLDMDHNLKGKERVIEICKVLGATTYINPIGGLSLYDKSEFSKQGIDLRFLKTGSFEYKQFNNIFIPNLSIIDVMMFNSKIKIRELLDLYEFC